MSYVLIRAQPIMDTTMRTRLRKGGPTIYSYVAGSWQRSGDIRKALQYNNPLASLKALQGRVEGRTSPIRKGGGRHPIYEFDVYNMGRLPNVTFAMVPLPMMMARELNNG